MFPTPENGASLIPSVLSPFQKCGAKTVKKSRHSENSSGQKVVYLNTDIAAHVKKRHTFIQFRNAPTGLGETNRAILDWLEFWPQTGGHGPWYIPDTSFFDGVEGVRVGEKLGHALQLPLYHGIGDVLDRAVQQAHALLERRLQEVNRVIVLNVRVATECITRQTQQ